MSSITAPAVAIDPQGNLYVTGLTNSSDFPVTKDAFQPMGPARGPFGLRSWSFLFKLNRDGTVGYSTYFSPSETNPKAIAVDGAGSAYFTGSTAYFVMKREPGKTDGSRSKILLRDIGSFKTILGAHRITHGDFFDRVDVGMRDFVWEYRKRLSGKAGQEFEAKLMALMSIGKDGLMGEKLFKMDQHA